MVAVGALLLAPGTRAACAQTAAPTQTIDSIVVLNEDVFAREEEDLTFLAKLANALHIRTRAATIRRTLLLNQGDPFDSARIVESERALRSLAVFRQVALDTAWVRNRLYLLVVTGDGWSTRPHLNFSSAAGDESWSIGITEENFLGTATEVGLGYYKSVDRSAFELAYRNPHFIARRALLLLRYADLSDGTRASWRLGIPFAQTAARGALETSGAIGEGRVLVFKANDRDTTYLDTTYQHRSARFTLRGGVALSATSRSYVRAWLAATVRRQDYGAENAVTLPHSVFGTVGAGVDFGRPRYHILRRFNSYARREDVDLSHAARVALWVAPSAWGYPAGRAGLGPELSFQTSAVWSGGFTVLRGWGHGIFGSAGLDSGRVAMSVTLGSQNFPGQSLVVHGQVAAAHKPAPGDAYDFWYDRSGPRLFGAHAFTGTRLVWFTVEDRIVIDDDFYGLMGIGLAPFFDWGGVWFMDEEPRTGGNVGLALRLGPTRATQGDPAEISFGARFGAGVTNRNRWALTIRRALRF
jgi:hypothetical protein